MIRTYELSKVTYKYTLLQI